ncbi:MAG: aspartyl protease family protein [Candidatus Baldrarchaeia archaeon]
MRAEQVFAGVELKHEDKTISVRALVDTGASRSVISLRLARRL